MNKHVWIAALFAGLLAGCGDDKAATQSIEGKVEVFSIGTAVQGATVDLLNFDQPMGITATSGAGGAIKIEGVPQGTDVTLAVLASDSYLGKPTFTFHVGGSPIQSDLTGRTFYLVNTSLATTMLTLLGASGVPAGVGVLAGSVVRVVDGEEKGIFGAKAAVDSGLSPIYFAGLVPDLQAKSSDASGRFIFFGLPVGKATITATGSDGSALGTSTVGVYDQSVSLVTIYAQ
ncbi:MAG: hypothetical protein HYT87_06290 [Nitrospirae bacterium]|nr:hypothetical protein [Nitrospirota bacterium]